MNKNRIITLILAFIMMTSLCPNAFAVTTSIGEYTPIINPYPDPGIELPERHPRVYFKEGDIERILEDKNKGDNVEAWAAQQTNLEKGLSSSFTGTLPTPASGKTNDNGSITACIEALAFDYVINKNRASGEKAVSALNNYLGTVVFTGAYSDTYVRAAGQLIFHVAEVYDWCYDLIDNNTKKYFIDRVIKIAEDGLEVRWPFDGNGVASHVSEAQLQRDLLAFAIAVGDERPDIFKRMMGVMYKNYVPQRTRIYNSFMQTQGSQYGCYRGRWELLATILMDKIGVPNLYGENQHYFPYWYLYARRPDGLVMRDGDARTDGNKIGGFMTRHDMIRVMLISSYYWQDEYLKEEFNRNFNAWREFGDSHDGMTPVEFICFFDADLGVKSSSSLPLTRYFPSPKGAMFARTGFNYGMDSNDVVAYMNLEEYNFSNHDHLDAGHFQIYYKGILANDAGSYVSYGSAHDRGYYKRSVAHNTMAVRNPSSPVTFQGYTTYDGGQRAGRNGADAGADVFETDDYRFGEILGHEFGKDKKTPDYSYLAGNLTRAYNSDTVENYERSFMFYNLKDYKHPAAMIVFDRITSVKSSYKKAWLLNGPSLPAISGNRTVFVNNENGYNGKMTVDTLLPESIDIVTIGGEGQEAYVAGTNYSANVTLNSSLSHEAQGYRIEISPTQNLKKDLFLNVIQVGDADSSTNAYTPTLIQNNSCVGTILDDTVTIFKPDYGRSNKTVSFTLPSGNYKIAVCDNVAGEWSVIKDGNDFLTVSAKKNGGVLYFNGTGGTYYITYKGESTAVAKVIWENAGILLDDDENTFAITGDITEDDAEVPEGTKVHIGIYGSDNRLLDLNTQNYTADIAIKSKKFLRSYNGILPAYTKLFVWNGMEAFADVKTFEIDYSKNIADMEDIRIKANDEYVYCDVPGKEYEGNIYLPLRAVAEKIGATVSWENGKATVKYGSKTMVLQGNSDEILVNGDTEYLDYATIRLGSTILVCPNLFSEYMNCSWEYDSSIKTCILRYYLIGSVSDSQGELYFPQMHSEISNVLNVYGVFQSGSEYGIGGNDITRTLDGDYGTRWAVEGTRANPSFGIYDFGSVKTLDKLYIAYYKGASRKAYFGVEVSEDGWDYTTVISNGVSGGKTTGFEAFNLGGVRARYLKIYGYGNNSSSSASWNSITELAVSGR